MVLALVVGRVDNAVHQINLYLVDSEVPSLNPLTPKSDQLLISLYNINPKSNSKVTRIK